MTNAITYLFFPSTRYVYYARILALKIVFREALRLCPIGETKLFREISNVFKPPAAIFIQKENTRNFEYERF